MNYPTLVTAGLDYSLVSEGVWTLDDQTAMHAMHNDRSRHWQHSHLPPWYGGGEIYSKEEQFALTIRSLPPQSARAILKDKETEEFISTVVPLRPDWDNEPSHPKWQRRRDIKRELEARGVSMYEQLALAEKIMREEGSW